MMLNKKYKLLHPKDFTQEHTSFIAKFIDSTSLLSDQSGIIFGAKDIESRHIISTDSYAKLVGLDYGKNVSGRFDKEMPCCGTVEYADIYVKEDQNLLYTLNPENNIQILNVHNYSNGLGAVIFNKNILYHQNTNSILGTVYSGFRIELKNVMNIIPNYIIRFGITGSIQALDNNAKVDNIILTDYEQEICFLLLLNWNCGQIANFMNEFRPKDKYRTTDTILKKKNQICEKFSLPTNSIQKLQEFLISVGFQNSMPRSFYNRIIGSQVL